MVELEDEYETRLKWALTIQAREKTQNFRGILDINRHILYQYKIIITFCASYYAPERAQILFSLTEVGTHNTE